MINVQIRPSAGANSNRRGAILMLIVFCLPILLAFGAYAINVAWMQLARTELRTATDAAVRAGGRTFSISSDVDVARQWAKDAARLNAVAGAPLVLADADVQFGYSELTASGSYQFTPSADTAPLITGLRVTGDKTGSNAVPMLFTGFFDRTTFEPVKSAVATQIDRDVILVLDRSGSMNRRSGTGSRWTALQQAVNAFLDALEQTPQSEKVGIVTYASDARIDENMVLNYGLLRRTVSQIRPRGATAIGRGIENGITAISDPRYSRSAAAKTIVVMTDGHHNRGINPDTVALSAAGRNITVHSITFSSGADRGAMQRVARDGNGQHWHADDQASLIHVFREVANNLPTLITE